MTVQDKTDAINKLYESIHSYQYKSNAETLYNLIHAKKIFGLTDIKQSLYLDIKQFVHNYMYAANKADYGYDEIRLDKILNVTKCLDDLKQQKSILCVTRRNFQIQGYETDDLLSEINKLDLKIAYNEKRYFKMACLFLGSNLWMLILSYLFYVIALGLLLLPAPFEWMGIFTLEMKQFSDNCLLNHVANTLMLLSGRDDVAPSIVPNCIAGVLVYTLGIILFYFFFANFILKKLDDFLSIK